MKKRQASGCLFGVALGDALGFDTEFMSVEEILARFPPDGPQEPEGNPALVTDDTQMTLALAKAFYYTDGPWTPQKLEGAIREAFVAWAFGADNDRAPGNTCMRACFDLRDGKEWMQASVITSKGCGANMRVAPVALLDVEKYGLSEVDRGGIAQFQAAMTHGHPTALAASDLTVQTLVDLKHGGDLEGLPQRLREYAKSQRNVYHEKWLGELWQRTTVESPQVFIAQGWDECLGVLDRLDEALAHPRREIDPCLLTGAGWIAEEAFATGLLCFLYFPDASVAALRRAAVSSGDSDSIASLTGAFAGITYGLETFPKAWRDRIEYREQLNLYGSAWD